MALKQVAADRGLPLVDDQEERVILRGGGRRQDLRGENRPSGR